MAAVYSQIYVEPYEALRADRDLKDSLKDEGVQIGYPYCAVLMDSQDKEFRIAEIFSYYGWDFQVHGGYYSATQQVDKVQI